MPWIIGTIGIAASVGGMLMGASAADEAASAQLEQAQRQQMNADHVGRMSSDRANRAIAKKNAAQRYRNRKIAENALYVRSMAELDLRESTDIAYANAATAYQNSIANNMSSRTAKGTSRGGTAKAIRAMLRARSAKDIATFGEQERRAKKKIKSQHDAALAQRNFTFEEASVYLPGAPPVYQGGTAQSLAAGMQGAQAGLSIVSSLSNLGGQTNTTNPTTTPSSSGGRVTVW